jgi:site-specific recombinase XerD
MNAMVNEFCLYLGSTGKSNSTVESYGRDARDFLDWLEGSRTALASVEPKILLEYQTRAEGNGVRKNSLRRRLIAIRQFFRFLVQRNYLPESPLDRMPIPSRLEKMPPVFSEAEFAQLTSSANAQEHTLKRCRDLSLLQLLGIEGLKASELIELQPSQILQDAELMYLRVPGAHKRTILMSPSTRQALLDYLDALQAPVADASQAWSRLFVGFKGRGEPQVHGQLTRHGLKFLLYELGDKTHLAHINTESLRHFAIAKMIECQWEANKIMSHLGLKQLGVITRHFETKRTTVQCDQLPDPKNPGKETSIHPPVTAHVF